MDIEDIQDIDAISISSSVSSSISTTSQKVIKTFFSGQSPPHYILVVELGFANSAAQVFHTPRESFRKSWSQKSTLSSRFLVSRMYSRLEK